ncbi:MAG: response regulator [Mycobacteriales bacterium]|nr:response regulator [Mycobacteriales bacterium]
MKARILVAEDDADHAFFTVRAFHDAHGAGVEIVTVKDGEEALDFLHRRGDYADAERPHLVVLDLKMPKVNGLEVLEAIKGDASLCTIPTVVLSSSDRPEDVRDSYERQANSYVTKPASLSGLREGVQQMARYWIDVSTLPEQDPAQRSR